MQPIIRALLDVLLGPGWDIQIVSNDVRAREGKDLNDEGGWRIEFHDDSIHGHDKSLEIRKYSSLPNRPTMFYAGDGVSDLSAAKETDLLFAKADMDLVTWCENENVPLSPSATGPASPRPSRKLSLVICLSRTLPVAASNSSTYFGNKNGKGKEVSMLDQKTHRIER
ncbi:hypothetical protein NW754_000742 [Fusarium falciforme]|nr:hypothetical protein NW754_000742 [Fusarium falciforme]